MKRRLDLAMTLVAAPSVIFLDEPTTGLDPRSRHTMWDIVRGLVADGTTVLLTTQYLDEADELADRIAVLDGGRIVAEGTPGRAQAAGARRAHPAPVRGRRGARRRRPGCSTGPPATTPTLDAHRAERRRRRRRCAPCSTASTRPTSRSTTSASTPPTSTTCSSRSPAGSRRREPHHDHHHRQRPTSPRTAGVARRRRRGHDAAPQPAAHRSATPACRCSPSSGRS